VLWHAGNEQEEAIYLGALRQGFSEIGYVEGKDFVLENRYAAEQYEHYAPLPNSIDAEHNEAIGHRMTHSQGSNSAAGGGFPLIRVITARGEMSAKRHKLMADWDRFCQGG